MEDFSDVVLREDRSTERLVDLAMYLQSSSRGFTREEIGRNVPNYKPEDVDNFGRMFERDKVELMSIGFDIEVVQGDAYNQDEFRYRIIPSKNLLPEIGFDEAEMKVLVQATQAWRSTALQDDANQTLLKLETLGVHADPDSQIAEFTIGTELKSVAQAIASRRVLHFEYRKPHQIEPEKRKLAAWGLVLRRGAWYVFGEDLVRSAPRCFNLARVTSAMSTAGKADAYEIPTEFDVEELFNPINRGEESVTLTLQIAEGHGHVWRRISQEQNAETFVVTLDDPKRQIPILASDAPHVIVLEPEHIRTEVINILRGAL